MAQWGLATGRSVYPGVVTVGAKRAIDIVEAAYDLGGSETEWLSRVLEIARKDIDTGDGVYAFTGNEKENEPNLEAAPVFVAHDLHPGFAERLAELNRNAPRAVYEYLSKRLVTCGGLESTVGEGSPILDHFRALMKPTGIVDGFSMFAQDGELGSLTMSAPARRVIAPAPRIRGIWRRVGLHAAAALRLRRKLVAKATAVEAVLDASGKVHDAKADVPRDALKAAVRAMDRARTRKLRAMPEEALELWKGLVAGEWSLVEQWERDGKRFLAAYRNQPQLLDPRGLIASERAVLRYVTLGASNKDVAFALGLPLGTVSSAITSILRKLGMKRRVELALLSAPSRLDRLDVDLEDDGQLSVLAVDTGPVSDEKLSPTEREVASFVVQGWSNQRIADQRGVSVKTIMNQVRGIFEKLNVASRSELTVRLSRPLPPHAPR